MVIFGEYSSSSRISFVGKVRTVLKSYQERNLLLVKGIESGLTDGYKARYRFLEVQNLDP